MNNLEKYTDHLMEQKPVNFEMLREPASESTFDLIKAILRRWHIVLLVFFVMCATGLAAIWFLIEPLYNVTGAIRVAPILRNIITGEAETGEISNYQMFMQTQAEMLASEPVLQRVADDLVDKHLFFFEDEPTDVVTKVKKKLELIEAKPDAVTKLKQAISAGVIRVAPGRRSELLKVSMTSANPGEAKQIVDAFISAYMAVEVSNSAQGLDHQLNVLEDERTVLAKKLQSQHAGIRQLAEEYGTTDLISRQDMQLRRVISLLSELTRIEANRINLEAQVQFLEQTKEQAITPESLLRMRNEHINSDPMVEELTRNIVQLERDLIIAGQTFTPDNPNLQQRQELLDAFDAHLEEKRQEITDNFNESASEEIEKARAERMHNTQIELEQNKVHEKRLRDVLAKEDTYVIELGRKQLNIEDLQFQQNLDQEIYDTVRRRVRDLEMERKLPARVSIAYNADVSSVQDKRAKYSAALLFGALFCGMALAFLRDKTDQRLQTPEDVTKRIDIRIIGTTTSSHRIKPALLPAQMAGDYQTIRANLGLFNHGGMPKKLVITSPGMREGKTTFAINLATSIAESGKKVLLIDGDLRKPDIAFMLNLPQGTKGLQALFSGIEFDQAVYCIPSTGLNVLASHSSNDSNAYELIASPLMAQYVNKLSQNYDHIIIDTPPVLAFPDTLLWAQITDAVILTSFAGQTTTPELREAKQRLTQINVRVLGAVLSNVRVDHSYYHYNYYAQNIRSKKNRKRANTRLLLPPGAKKGNSENPDS